MKCAAVLVLAACQVDNRIVNPGGNAQSSSSAEEQLLILAPDQGLSSQQDARLVRARGKSESKMVRVGRLNSAASQLLQRGNRITLSLSPTIAVVATGSVEVRHANGRVSWAGATADSLGWVQLVLAPAGLYGMVTSGKSRYWIEPIGEGLHAIVELDDSKFPPEHPANAPTGTRASTRTRVSGSAANTSSVSGFGAGSSAAFQAMRQGPRAVFDYTADNTPGDLDLVVVYTAAAASATADIESLVQLAVDVENTSYSDSYVSLTASVVYSGQVTYNEAYYSYGQHIAFLSGSSTVAALRNQYLGDAVVLIVDDDEACGQAYEILASATHAFAVVHYGCAAGNWTLAHELGHLQGARHDRDNDNTSTPFQYGHGYRVPDFFRTIMAYDCVGHPCPRHGWWATPLESPYLGMIYPVRGSADYEDDARVLNETKYDVTGFREPISVVISGSPTAISTQISCTWEAVISGGSPATSYAWSGILSGSGSSVSGAVPQTGYLYLLVYDAYGRYNTAQLEVIVDDNGPGC